MSDDPMIAKAVETITHHEGEAARHTSEAIRWKNWVNDFDRLAGRDPRYADVPGPTVAATSPAPAVNRVAGVTWEPGDFFGKPLATAAKMALSARHELAGKPAPASVDEIRDSLAQGSFDFGTTNVEQQKQSIRISLGKNSVTFVKLPGTELFGLPEWYGQRPRERVRLRRNGDSPASTDAVESEGAAGDAAAETASNGTEGQQ